MILSNLHPLTVAVGNYVRLRSLDGNSKPASFRDQEQSARWTSDHSTFRGCRRAPRKLDIGNILSLALESSEYKRACTITILKRHEREISLLRILIKFSLSFGQKFRRWQGHLKTHTHLMVMHSYSMYVPFILMFSRPCPLLTGLNWAHPHSSDGDGS